MNIYLSWTDFKAQVVQKERVRFNEQDGFYTIYYKDDTGTLETSILKENPASSDQSDFQNNYKSLANKKLSTIDVDGSPIIRAKAAKTGWTYNLCPIEFKTSDLDSVYSKFKDGTNRAGIVYKIYDANDVEITDAQYELNSVKTVIDFEPTHDYEIIGGHIQQFTMPTSNIRVWVIAVPDVSEAYGGSKEMVGGVNLKFIDPTDKITADGRVSKYMAYNATYHTNKIRLIVKHDAGIIHDLMLVLEMFKT